MRVTLTFVDQPQTDDLQIELLEAALPRLHETLSLDNFGKIYIVRGVHHNFDELLNRRISILLEEIGQYEKEKDEGAIN